MKANQSLLEMAVKINIPEDRMLRALNRLEEYCAEDWITEEAFVGFWMAFNAGNFVEFISQCNSLLPHYSAYGAIDELYEKTEAFKF